MSGEIVVTAEQLIDLIGSIGVVEIPVDGGNLVTLADGTTVAATTGDAVAKWLHYLLQTVRVDRQVNERRRENAQRLADELAEFMTEGRPR